MVFRLLLAREGADVAAFGVRSEADVVAANGRDEFAVYARGAGAAKRVIRRDAEKESSAGVLDVDNEVQSACCRPCMAILRELYRSRG